MAETPTPLPVHQVSLGQPVRFTWTLTRRYRPGSPHSRKVWETVLWPGQPEPAPRTGIVIGVRTLSNGENHYHGYEEPIEYRVKETFTAYLVAHDLRRKPVFVLPEHLTVEAVAEPR